MLLAREFVSYLSRQIVRKLTPQIPDHRHIITEDLTIEDRHEERDRKLAAARTQRQIRCQQAA